MRFNPLLGFVVLIGLAVGVSFFASLKHKNTGDIPPTEQAQIDAEKERAEAIKRANEQKAQMLSFEQVKEGAVQVTMEVENRGTVVMELYPKAAPKTVTHFTDLVKKHFYDGLKFHRLEPGFVVQGGDPESKNASVDEFDAKKIGTHGSGQNVPLEVKLPHALYSVGLARSTAPDSGDSQFYINLSNNKSLDGNYCVFGMVTKGQDVAGKIQKGDVIKSITMN